MWFTAHAEWEQASLSTTEVTRQYRSVSLARWLTSDPTSLSVELLLRGRNAEWTWHVTGGRVARMVGVGAMRLKASQTMEQREKKGVGWDGASVLPPHTSFPLCFALCPLPSSPPNVHFMTRHGSIRKSCGCYSHCKPVWPSGKTFC